MKKLLLAAAVLAVLPWVQGCDNPAARSAAYPGGRPAANAAAANPAATLTFVIPVEAVDSPANLGPPPHPKPKPMPHPKPIGVKPKGYFHPKPGHPYHGGQHGQWARYWMGHVHHGRHYLYGVYRPAWRGYTYRVWNGRWLYWSPADYCWYRYDPVLRVFIPLNLDGMDAIDNSESTTPPPPPPPPPSPPSPPSR